MKFFMIIAGFMVSIFVFVHMYRNMNRYVSRFSGRNKAKQTAHVSGKTKSQNAGKTQTKQSDTSGNSGTDAVSGGATQSSDKAQNQPGSSGGKPGQSESTGDAQSNPEQEAAIDYDELPGSSDINKELKKGKRLYTKKQYFACVEIMDRILAGDPSDEQYTEAENYKNLSETVLRNRGEL